MVNADLAKLVTFAQTKLWAYMEAISTITIFVVT